MFIHDESSEHNALSTTLEALYQNEAWENIDAALSIEKLADAQDRNWYFYKITAMSHLEHRQNTDEFIQIAEAALALAPSPLFFSVLADAYFARDQFDQTVTVLMSWREHEPENPEIQRRLFLCFQHLKDENAQANALFHFHLFAGKAKQKALDFQGSLEHFEYCHHIAPDFDHATLLLAQSLFYSQHFSRAMTVAQSIADASPLKSAAEELALRAVVRAGDWQAGNAIAESLLETDSAHLVALRSQIRIAEETGYFIDGIHLCRKILEVYPFDVAANLKLTQLTKNLVEGHYSTVAYTEEQKIALAEILLRSGYSNAGQDLLKAIAPESSYYIQAGETLARHFIAQRQYAEALAQLAPTQPISPKGNALRLLRAECLFQLNRHTEAAEEAQYDLTENPHHYRSGFLFGASLLNNYHNDPIPVLESKEEIQQRLRDYAEQAPNDGAPYLQLAHLADITDEPEAIKTAIEEARIRGHRSPFACLLMGRYHLARDEPKEALEELNDSVNLCSKHPYYSALVARAELLRDLGETEKAEEDLNILLQNWPNDPRVLALRDTLFADSALNTDSDLPKDA